jgi:hypothetical protein
MKSSTDSLGQPAPKSALLQGPGRTTLMPEAKGRLQGQSAPGHRHDEKKRFKRDDVFGLGLLC